MTGELYINEKDAYTTWGVNMGEGFLDAIDAPLPMKEYVEDESRLEDGIRIDTGNPKVDSREITLGFTIMGSSETDYRSKKAAFQTELQKGALARRSTRWCIPERAYPTVSARGVTSDISQ